MSNKMNKLLSSAILAGGFKAVAFHITKTFIIPIGTPIMIFVLGYLEEMPWFYIWLGVLASLSFVFTWLLRMDEWLYRQRSKDKIAFSRVKFSRNIKGEGVSIGFEVTNLADFPIDFEVPKLDVRLGNIIPSKDHQQGQVITIPPKCMGWYDSNIIKIDNPPKSGTVEGCIDFSINYGRSAGAQRHSFSAKKQIVVFFNQDGLLEHGVWNDAV
jgi:hypothetical protein